MVLQNSFEGLIVENIFLKEGIKDKLNIITIIGFCDTLIFPTDKKACLIHFTTKTKVLDDEEYIKLLTILKKR